MEKNPFAGVPVLTPEQTQQLLVDNHNLGQRLMAVEGQMATLHVILASCIFREKGLLVDNMIAAQGHTALNITGPLETTISQNQINALEHMFNGDRPTVVFKQELIIGMPILRISLVPLTEAEQQAQMKMN